MSNNCQKTIGAPVSFAGIGVHTGNRTTMTFKPAGINHGIVFVRTDLQGCPVIEASVDNVADTQRGTILGKNGVFVHTIEHVLSSISVYGITNLIIEIDSNEPPVGDGSSLPYIDMLKNVDIVEQEASAREPIVITEPLWVSEGDMIALVLPADEYKISYTIAYGHPLLGSQFYSCRVNQETFIEQIAPCRTFCFYRDVKELMDKGLIKGGSLENAVVITDEVILSKEELRFKDEFVRHKILDLIGDLSLLQRPLKGHVIAIKSGHGLNVKLARKLIQYAQKKEKAMVPLNTIGKLDYILTIEDIEKILPHRYPFLLVDRIVSLEDTKAVGIKNVTRNEEFFQGHFPGKPIMPGVLIIEALAQVAGILMLTKSENSGKLAYFMSIDNAKFRRTVVPGDQLTLKVEILKAKSRTGKARGEAFVEGVLAAEADFMFSMVDNG